MHGVRGAGYGAWAAGQRSTGINIDSGCEEASGKRRVAGRGGPDRSDRIEQSFGREARDEDTSQQAESRF